MKKLLFSLIALGCIFSAQAQTSNGGQKKTSVAIRFNALDFGSAYKVQNGSIGSVLNEKKWGQYASTTKSFGVNYTKQYTDQVDIYSNLDIAVTRLPLYLPNTFTVSNENLLTSFESGINYKMFKFQSGEIIPISPTPTAAQTSAPTPPHPSSAQAYHLNVISWRLTFRP